MISIRYGAPDYGNLQGNRLEWPNPGLKFFAEIWSPFSTSNPAGRLFFHQRRNGAAPCEGDLHGSQASCEPTSTNSKFSLPPYQPFDLPNKQLLQPSLFFSSATSLQSRIQW
jgi:hypothetical protein